MKNSAEKTELLKLEEFEIGGQEMLDLAETNPEDFILQYDVKPAMDLIKQGRWYYDLIIAKPPREQDEVEAYLKKWQETIGYDPNGNPQNSAWLDHLREDYQQVTSPQFCFFGKKTGQPEEGGEVRLYLSIKQDRLLDFVEQLSGVLGNVASMYAFKINISNRERNDNAVVYLDNKASRADIDRLLEAVAGLPGQIDEVFNKYDFTTPLSRPIVAPDQSTVVGQLSYNPFMSYKGKATISGEEAHTTNQVFGRLVQGVKAHSSILDIYTEDSGQIIEPENHPEKWQQLAEILMNEKIAYQNEKYGEKNILSVIEYCRLCLGKIDDILSKK